MRVREATVADRPFLEACAIAAFEERDYASTIGAVDWQSLSLTETAVAILACDPDPIGCFIAGIVEHPLNGERYADQVLWYVVPERRKGRAARLLLTAYTDWALRAGVTRCTVKRPAIEAGRGCVRRRRGERAIEVTSVITLTR